MGETTRRTRRAFASCEGVTGFFKVLADETRLKILFSLFGGSMCVMHISEHTGMSQSAVSHQLAILRRANLVKVTRNGKQQVYSLADDHVRIVVDMAQVHVSEKMMGGDNFVKQQL